MITISYWARQNVWAAQVILTICLILLIVTGVEFGIFLKAFGTTLPDIWVYFFALLGFLILAFGPNVRFSKRDLKQYRNMRMLSGLVSISSFALAIGWGNQLCTPSVESVSLPKFERAAYTSLAVSGVMIDNSSSHRLKLAMPFQKIFQKKAMKRMEKWRSGKEPLSETERTLLGILFCGLALLLMFFGTFFACGLACEGYGFFAVVVLLLGIAGAIGLFYQAAKKFFPNKSNGYKWRFGALAPIVAVALLILLILAGGG